jgi:hypothetical protein
MKRLHDEARSHNMVVWYSLVGLNGKATPDDIMDLAIKPRPGEWYRQGGPDKFLGSTLEFRKEASTGAALPFTCSASAVACCSRSSMRRGR